VVGSPFESEEKEKDEVELVSPPMPLHDDSRRMSSLAKFIGDDADAAASWLWL
jgi:hypothetical protein